MSVIYLVIESIVRRLVVRRQPGLLRQALKHNAETLCAGGVESLRVEVHANLLLAKAAPFSHYF